MNNESKQEKGRNKLRDCLQTAQWMWRVKYEWELLWREAKGSQFFCCDEEGGLFARDQKKVQSCVCHILHGHLRRMRAIKAKAKFKSG